LHYHVYYLIGRVIFKRSGAIAGIDYFEKVIDEGHTHPRILNTLGSLYFLAGRSSAAKTTFKKSIEQSPNILISYLDFLPILFYDGDYEEFLFYFNRFELYYFKRSEFRDESAMQYYNQPKIRYHISRIREMKEMLDSKTISP